jgi:ribosomal protein S27AE
MFEPKCPRCGRRVTLTNWSMPYPQWQCIPCEQAEKARQEEKVNKIKGEMK